MGNKNKLSYKNFLKKGELPNVNQSKNSTPYRTRPWSFSRWRDWNEGNFKRIVLINFRNKRFRKQHELTVLEQDGSDIFFFLKDEEGKTHHFVRVRDISTGEYHILRVPRNMTSCKGAIAWTFGMSKEEYKLLKEA